MKKFFKMSLAICMVLVLLFSLAACSGGRGSGGNSGNVSSTTEHGVGDGADDDGFEENGSLDGDGSGSSSERDANGMYVYQVGSCEVPCKTNIKEYIHGDSVDFEKLAGDLGWHLFGKDLYKNGCHHFVYANTDESKVIMITFRSGNSLLCNRINFARMEDGRVSSTVVGVVDTERSGDVDAYRIAQDSTTDLTRNMIVVCLFLLENYADNSENPLDAYLSRYKKGVDGYDIPE